MRTETIRMALIAILACAGASCAKERRMAWWGEHETQCAGRFCLEVPRAMERSGVYGIRAIALEELRWPEPKGGAFARAWAERVRKLESAKDGRMYPGDVAGTIVERQTLRPGALEAVYDLPEVDIEGRWTALLDAGPVGVWMEGQEHVDEKAALLASIHAIAAAYRPRAAGEAWPAGAADAFYMDAGRVDLPFDRAEEAKVFYQGLGMSFELRTEATEHPEKEGLLERFTRAIAEFGSSSGGMTTLRKRSRAVAGLRGDEVVVRAVEEREITFKFSFEGKARSATAPVVDLSMEAPMERKDEAMALWDALLDSMRPAR